MSPSEHKMFFMISISLIIPVILMILNLILFKKHFYSRNKPSAFECGFDPKFSSRIPFSLKFYLISIVFLIFDIEIALILPIPLILTSSVSLSMNLLLAIFIIILYLGLLAEWKEGALVWLS